MSLATSSWVRVMLHCRFDEFCAVGGSFRLC